jgi:hypothetical protein
MRSAPLLIVLLATGLLVLAAGGQAATPTQAPTAIALENAKLTSSWKQSWLTGRVNFSGSVTGPAELRASLRPVGGGRVAGAVDISMATAGKFAGLIKLPNRLLPKLYRLSVTATSGDVLVPSVHRDLRLPAPPEGIVDRAWASRTKNGPPVDTIPGNPTEVWGHFHFVVPPKSRKVRNRWYSPNFRWWGEKKNKPWTPTVHTRLAAAKLDKGVWFAYMFSENRVVKKWRVRLGSP